MTHLRISQIIKIKCGTFHQNSRCIFINHGRCPTHCTGKCYGCFSIFTNRNHNILIAHFYFFTIQKLQFFIFESFSNGYFNIFTTVNFFYFIKIEGVKWLPSFKHKFVCQISYSINWSHPRTQKISFRNCQIWIF